MLLDRFEIMDSARQYNTRANFKNDLPTDRSSFNAARPLVHKHLQMGMGMLTIESILPDAPMCFGIVICYVYRPRFNLRLLRLL